MTRQEIEQSYTTQNGAIVSPGKFEGEPIFTPYFWDATMDGSADHEFYYGEGGNTEFLVAVTAEDRAMFPELDPTTQYVAISESDQGFVYSEELTEADAQKAIEQYEAWSTENEATT